MAQRFAPVKKEERSPFEERRRDGENDAASSANERYGVMQGTRDEEGEKMVVGGGRRERGGGGGAAKDDGKEGEEAAFTARYTASAPRVRWGSWIQPLDTPGDTGGRTAV